SAGIIAMVCLNLLGSLRYKQENIYPVGLIPGPGEPTLTDLNHYLRLLVDSFLKLWDPGVYFNKTASKPEGRNVRAAIIPLIADYPACRRALGVKISARSNENFCTFCDIPQRKIAEWLETNPELYPCRTAAHHQAIAFAWWDASSEAEQKAIFQEHGIRFTELLWLPYWDPTRFVVVDPMHNLFLSLIQTHFRDILG
ncbi:hypothetical protein K439DRAFT_1283045, partial [Ramaria rubella]